MYTYRLDPASFDNIDRKTVTFNCWSGSLHIYAARFVPVDNCDLLDCLQEVAHVVQDLLDDARLEYACSDFDCSLTWPCMVLDDDGHDHFYFAASDFVRDVL